MCKVAVRQGERGRLNSVTVISRLPGYLDRGDHELQRGRKVRLSELLSGPIAWQAHHSEPRALRPHQTANAIRQQISTISACAWPYTACRARPSDSSAAFLSSLIASFMSCPELQSPANLRASRRCRKLSKKDRPKAVSLARISAENLRSDHSSAPQSDQSAESHYKPGQPSADNRAGDSCRRHFECYRVYAATFAAWVGRLLGDTVDASCKPDSEGIST